MDVIPLVMRTVAFELRRTEHVLVTPHFRLLLMLKHHAFTLSELAEHQSVSLPTMSNTVSILEERGWVTRTRSEEDRRKVRIDLCPAGHAVLDEVRQQAEARVTELLEHLSQPERKTLFAAFSILRGAFGPVENCPSDHHPTG